MKITSDLYQDIDGEASCSTEASFGDGSRGEVKQLQDSLTAFFTPSNRRRSRVAQSSFSLDQIIETTNMVCRVSNGTGVKAKVTGDLSENRRQSAFESHDTMKTRNIASTSTSDVKEILDNVDVHHNGCPKPKMCVMRPLTVITDDDEEASLHSRRSTCPLTSSRNTVPFSSFRASNVLSPPHRKTDKLYDSLSPYYSPKSSEKRRTVCKGEYAQLSGIRTRVRSGGSSSAQEQLSPPALSVVEQARRNEDHSSIGSTSQEERSDSEKLADDEKCITRSKVKKTHSNVNMSNRIRVAEKSTKRTKSPLTLHSFFKSSQPQNSLPVPETTHTSATSHIIDAAHTVSPRRSKLISNSSSGARFQSHRSVSVNLVRKAKARKAGLKTQCERSRTNCYKRFSNNSYRSCIYFGLKYGSKVILQRI
ncbi:hypothetical protein AB6A40_009369 [Gnathostoma spinigerum]|uniref:Uncharacterized protein n=1 Tax=Gnathostoma spinigerum TaxID=75299 RepID=A0ABD6ET02_9BILA